MLFALLLMLKAWNIIKIRGILSSVTCPKTAQCVWCKVTKLDHLVWSVDNCVTEQSI